MKRAFSSMNMEPSSWICIALVVNPLVSYSTCAFSVSWHLLHDGQDTDLAYGACVYGLPEGDTCQFNISMGDTLRSSWYYWIGGGCSPWTFTLYRDGVEVSSIDHLGHWLLTEPAPYRCHVAGLGGVSAYWRLNIVDANGIPRDGRQGEIEGLAALVISEGTVVSGELVLNKGGQFSIELLDVSGRLFQRQNLRASTGRTPFSMAIANLGVGCYFFRAEDKSRSFTRRVFLR